MVAGGTLLLMFFVLLVRAAVAWFANLLAAIRTILRLDRQKLAVRTCQVVEHFVFSRVQAHEMSLHVIQSLVDLEGGTYSLQ